ncbi:MAG TPA: methyltransferase [Edaphobacter sp.]
MSTAEWTEVAAIYVPLMAAILLRLIHGRRERQFAACLLGSLWVATTLPLLERVNAWAGWWAFHGDFGVPSGMPLELYFGWMLLWGVVPQMAFPRLRLRWVVMVLIAVDLVTMPLFGAVVVLNSGWLVGEAAEIAVVLAPALCLARWTLEDRHLRWRATMQVIVAGLLFLYMLPAVLFGWFRGVGWAPLLAMNGWVRQMGMQLLVLLALTGVSAVMEFAERGDGTPIPYDPPKKLVRSGMYRYVANPMQISCAMVMLLWATMLGSGWFACAAVMAVVYSVGIAEWNEREDLKGRFGEAWVAYRAVVKNWRLRWRPYVGETTARIYIAEGCGPCSEVWRWLAERKPVGMEIVAAETLPYGSIRRMRYVCDDYEVEGVRAFARALEHLHFGFAFVGAGVRLPGVWQAIQFVVDECGLGPRVVGKRCG